MRMSWIRHLTSLLAGLTAGMYFTLWHLSALVDSGLDCLGG